MEHQAIIDNLLNRENTLSVRKVTVNLTSGSIGNPQISVGTLPYYEWDKDKRVTYIITYGRFINCEMLVYEKLLKDIEHLKTKDKDEAQTYIKNIIAKATQKAN